MKRLIVVAAMWLVMLTGIYAGGVQYLKEHHETQKIIIMNVHKAKEIDIPEGWHVVDIVAADLTVIVIVLERNHE